MTEYFNRFNLDYFFQIPVVTKVVTALLIFYLIILVVTVVTFFILRKKEIPHRSFAKKIIWTEAPVAVLGLFLVFARFEGLNIYSWRFFQYLLLIVLIGVNIWIFLKYRKFKEELFRHYAKKRKEKWLKKQIKGKK